MHSTIALLVAHHRQFGYRHFVSITCGIPRRLDDLRRRLTAIDANADIRCFLLTLPADENLRRIDRRQQARALDERDFERRTVVDEREALSKASNVGEPFDVSASRDALVTAMLSRLELAK